MTSQNSPQPDLFNAPQTFRMTVPVPAHVRDVFQRLAAAQGCSVGRAMGEWLADTLEGAEAMAEMLEKARLAPKTAIMEVHSYALGVADMTQDVLSYLRSKDAIVAAAKLKKGDTPPYSNTGGKGVPKRGRSKGADAEGKA